MKWLHGLSDIGYFHKNKMVLLFIVKKRLDEQSVHKFWLK